MINLILFELSDSLITDSVEYAQVMTGDDRWDTWQLAVHKLNEPAKSRVCDCFLDFPINTK
ncbi:MAG: hypothetical protein M1381_09325 [Deltaproteobacteria bacterium]|nr:hypothetical protein [Deltaproteobacteria bacterium]MCL5792766.1 hypothetical protein [Deltaproteobacteria bacterium]